jgi:hypothetical protein
MDGEASYIIFRARRFSVVDLSLVLLSDEKVDFNTLCFLFLLLYFFLFAWSLREEEWLSSGFPFISWFSILLDLEHGVVLPSYTSASI